MVNVAIYTDGAARGNPGMSASGYLIFKEGVERVASDSVFNGTKTNNFAEYNAVALALKKALELFGPDCNVKLYSDSELVVRQLIGRYKIGNKYLKKQYMEVTSLIKKFASCELTSVPRENANISRVDKSLNILLDRLERESAQKTRYQIKQKKLS